jgi:hypothetical protein
MPIPTLLWSPKTKTNNETWIYYHEAVAYVVETRIMTETGLAPPIARVSCGGGDECLLGTEIITFLEKENCDPIGGGLIAALSPVGTAAAGALDPVTVGDYTVVAKIPDFTNATLICFDQGFNPTPGVTRKPIPRKFDPADHYVRQRPENSITLSDLYVSNWRGLQRIKGRRCTLFACVTPDGSGVFQEIQVYGNVLLNPKHMNSASDGNASIEISMDGTFSFVAIFSATPP